MRYADFQAFMKDLRHEFSYRDSFKNWWRLPIRFFMCGEYGEDLGRPHYHAGIFGTAFRADRKLWRRSGAGFRLYRSPTLERLWRFGNSEIGELTRESAAYMARYTFKKMSGDLAETHYRRIDGQTGEVHELVPEFARMSLKPGIGARWFQKYHPQVYAFDQVVVKGVVSRPPRYYDTLYGRLDEEGLEAVKFEREQKAKLGAADQTDARLAVREKVTEARLRYYKRSLK